ncbi:MAG: glycosyltransferase [Clostridia bacterium]|nr:MAG: glycosyltransferase [Clostridia bacterium]
MSSPTLSLCLIARDEATNLPRCLSSVQGLVDQIVVVDTGSKDNTIEVARRLGAEVYLFPWTDSFSEARNRSLELARGDWVLILDGDDEFVAEDAPLVRELLISPGYEAFFLQTINVLGTGTPEGGLRHPTLRLFRNRPEYRYIGRIHESVIPSILERAGREAIRVTDIRVRHYGYLKQAVQEKDKAHRNLALLEKEMASREPDSFLFYNLGVEYMRLGNNSRALEHFNLAEKDIQWRAAFAPSLARKKADCLAILGRRQEALAYLQQMTTIYPDFTDLFYQMGFLCIEEGDFPRAVQAFNKCLAMGEAPSHYPGELGVGGTLAWRVLGNIYELMLEREKACEAFRQELASNPRDMRPLGRIIRALLAGGTEEEAVAYLEACFNFPTPAANLGVAGFFLAQGHPRPALPFLEAAARLGAGDDYCHTLLGEALLLTGEGEKAARALERVDCQSPLYPRALRNMFLYHCLERDCSRAGELAARETDMPVREMYHYLCRSLAGRPSPALEAETLAAAGPAMLDLLEKTIIAGDRELAGKILELAVTPDLAAAAGKAAYRHGWQEKARELLLQGLEGGCQDDEAARTLARICRQEKAYEASAAWYAKAMEWDPDNLETYVEAARNCREEAMAALAGLPDTAAVIAALAGDDRPRLSLCMIVRDEEERLPRCLASVRGVVDEIVVVDTGSRDNTVDVAREFGARVYSLPWKGDFAAARNFALEQARGDWLLVMDADEELKSGDGNKIRALLTIDGVEAYCFQLVNFYGRQAGCDYVTDLACRMFKNRPAYSFRRALHEQVIDQILAVRGPGAVKVANLQVLHYGYLAPVADRKNKSRRNMEIIRQAVAQDPENKFLRYSLGVELLNQGAYEEALLRLEEAWQPGCSYMSDLVLKMAVCLREMRRHTQALRLIEQAARVYPDFTDLFFLQGEIHLEQGAYREAAACFEKCLEMGDAPVNYAGTSGAGSFRALYNLGRACEGLDQTEKAIAAYRRALQDNPKFHLPLYPLARGLRRLYGPAQAAASLEAFFDLSRTADLELLADVLMGCGDFDLALGYLEQVAPQGREDNPGTGRPAYMQGLCLAHLGRNSEASRCWQQVRPGSAYHLSALTWRYLLALRAGDGEQAAGLAKEIALASPGTGRAYGLIADILFQAGPHTTGPGCQGELDTALKDLAARCRSLGDHKLAERLTALGECA